MPRIPKPTWNPKRNQWVSKIGAKNKQGRAKLVLFPRSIGPTQHLEAMLHQRDYLAARSVTMIPYAGPAFTVYMLCEAYVAASERRRDAGRITDYHFRNFRHRLSLFLEFEIGGVPLKLRTVASVSPADMEFFIESYLAQGYSPYYVDALCSSIAAMFNWGAKRLADRPPIYDASPIKGFTTAVLPKIAERFVEARVAAGFLRHMRDHARWYLRKATPDPVGRHHAANTALFVRTLMRTGCRPGELCVLLWTDMRWNDGRTSAGHPYAKAVISPDRWKVGKSTGRTRTIYFSPRLSRALRREFESQHRHPTHVFFHGPGRHGIGSVAPWASGSVVSQTIRRRRREFVAADLEKPVMHDLACKRRIGVSDDGDNRIVNYLWRHTAASALIMMGLDLSTIAELLGTSVPMLNKHYGHLLDQHVAKAAESLARPRRASASVKPSTGISTASSASAPSEEASAPSHHVPESTPGASLPE